MVKSLTARLGRTLRAFHADEQGADMVEYILIFAAIALPLAAVLIYFKDEIGRWANEMWNNVKSGQGTAPQ